MVCGQQVAAYPPKEQGLLDILLLPIVQKARVPVWGGFKLRRLCDRAGRWPGEGTGPIYDSSTELHDYLRAFPPGFVQLPL